MIFMSIYINRRLILTILLASLIFSFQIPPSLAEEDRDSRLQDILKNMESEDIEDYIEKLKDKLSKWLDDCKDDKKDDRENDNEQDNKDNKITQDKDKDKDKDKEKDKKQEEEQEKENKKDKKKIKDKDEKHDEKQEKDQKDYDDVDDRNYKDPKNVEDKDKNEEQDKKSEEIDDKSREKNYPGDDEEKKSEENTPEEEEGFPESEISEEDPEYSNSEMINNSDNKEENPKNDVNDDNDDEDEAEQEQDDGQECPLEDELEDKQEHEEDTNIEWWHLGWYKDRKDDYEFGAVIIVEKKVEYKNSYMTEISFQFNPSWGDKFSLADGESKIFLVEPGTYIISETSNGGGDVSYIINNDMEKSGKTVEVTLDNFDVVKITFINKPLEFVIPEAPLGTIMITVAMLLAYVLKNKRLLLLK